MDILCTRTPPGERTNKTELLAEICRFKEAGGVQALRYIASCSFGKDSLGAILLAQKYGEPLDEAVYCEVMFDQNISGEVPEHRDFIYTKGIPALERMGIKVTVLRGEKDLSGSVHRANHPRP